MGNKNLVIHPRDPTTRPLELIYRDIDATVLERGATRDQLRRLIETHDRVILLGHGCPDGLYSVGQFPDSVLVIDQAFADQLRERDNTIFVWCYASAFACNCRLKGLATGMFISDPREAEFLGLKTRDVEIDESFNLFCNIVSRYIDQPLPFLKAAIDEEYGRLASVNPCAAYNHSRIRLFSEDWPADGDDIEMEIAVGPRGSLHEPLLPYPVAG